MCGLVAQLVEHRTGIRGGHEFEYRSSPEIFPGFFIQLLNWWAHDEDRNSACFSSP